MTEGSRRQKLAEDAWEGQLPFEIDDDAEVSCREAGRSISKGLRVASTERASCF